MLNYKIIAPIASIGNIEAIALFFKVLAAPPVELASIESVVVALGISMVGDAPDVAIAIAFLPLLSKITVFVPNPTAAVPNPPPVPDPEPL